MKTVEMADAMSPLADYAANARTETVVVTRRGKPVAAVVSVEGADMETLSLATNPDFLNRMDAPPRTRPNGLGCEGSGSRDGPLPVSSGLRG